MVKKYRCYTWSIFKLGTLKITYLNKLPKGVKKYYVGGKEIWGRSFGDDEVWIKVCRNNSGITFGTGLI